jgi:hypothetical protein
MNVFDFRDRLVTDYSAYVTSFISIRDVRIREMPRYWVPGNEVESRLARVPWNKGYLLAFRDVARGRCEAADIRNCVRRGSRAVRRTVPHLVVLKGVVRSWWRADHARPPNVSSRHLSIPFERASDLGTLRCAAIVEREGQNGARNMSSFPCSRGGSALDSAPWRSS